MANRRRGCAGGSPAARPSFWTLMKYFCAWLRICTHGAHRHDVATADSASPWKQYSLDPQNGSSHTRTDIHTHSIRDSRNQHLSVVTCMVVLVRTCSSIFFQSRPNLHRKKEERKSHGHQHRFLPVTERKKQRFRYHSEHKLL